MFIETKYDIGDKMFYTRMWENRVTVEKGTIKKINAGGKVWEEYDLGSVTRAEKDLFTDFTEAKARAVKEQKEQCEKLMEWVDAIEERDVRN